MLEKPNNEKVDLYFAYGSNMNFSQMKKRCPGSRIVGRAILKDWQYFINENGYAGIEPALGSLVRGGLWRIDAEHWEALDAYEGVKEGCYKKVRMEVFLEQNGTLEKKDVWLYLSNNYQYGKPTNSYQKVVLEGAKDFGLNPNYIKILSAWHEG